MNFSEDPLEGIKYLDTRVCSYKSLYKTLGHTYILTLTQKENIKLSMYN